MKYDVVMPTILRVGPYRFFFYSGDGGEPPCVHVVRDDDEAKFWLDPSRLERSRGFTRRELRDIELLVITHQQDLLEAWTDFFGP